MPVRLANAIVNVSLSEAFKEYMQNYTVSVTTATGHDFSWADDESRQLYVNPGSVMITVDFTKANGQHATAQIDPFTAEAQHRYNVTVDVEAGEAETLRLTFDDTITDVKEVDIDISDANLPMLAAAPEVLTEGFETGSVITTVAGSAYASPLKATVVARGKIDTAILNVNSAYLRSQGWPESIDLANPGANQSLLDKYGIKTLGLTGNKSVFAVIDFTQLISKVLYVDGEDNTSSFSLTVTDAQGKDKTADLFSLNVERLVLEILDGSEIISDGYAVVKVRYNGASSSDISLVAYNDRGTTDVLKVASVTPGSIDGTYDLTLESTVITLNSNLKIYAAAGTHQSSDYVLRVPSLRLVDAETNAFAKSAYASVILTNDDAAARKDKVSFEVSTDGGNTFSAVMSELTSSNFSARATRAGERKAIYKLSGLAASTGYMLRAKLDDEYSGATSFTTEEAAQLPNAGMEEWEKTASESNWDRWAINGWATYNNMTTMTSGTRHNTAYVSRSGSAQSTDAHSGTYAAELRTIGWGAGNSAYGTISDSNPKYINKGMLYLGTSPTEYSNLDEQVVKGSMFTSRPASISFWYKYSKKNDADYGGMSIWVKDASGNVIASATKSNLDASAYTEVTVPLTYNVTAAKAATIYVEFSSSDHPNWNTRSKDWFTTPSFGNLSDGKFQGSSMFVDDIMLNY